MSRCDCGVIGPPEDHDSHCSWHPSNVLRDEIDDLTAERDQLQARVDILAAALRSIATGALFIGDSEATSDEGYQEWARYVYPHREAKVIEKARAALAEAGLGEGE